MSVKITKLEGEIPKNVVIPTVNDLNLEPTTAGTRRRSVKTFPRGILKAKIVPVSNPSKRPQLKKTLRRLSINITTFNGDKHRNKTIKSKVRKMKDKEVRELVVKSGLSKGTGPPHILREVLEGGLAAGLVSQ